MSQPNQPASQSSDQSVPDVFFYHLERQSLEQALPKLLEATLARGWRAIVQAGSSERVKALSSHLWTYNPNSFLPHGSEEDVDMDGRAEYQPIWLTAEDDTPNQADVLFLVDGAEREALDSFQRCVYLFDGGDEEAITRAREIWQDVNKRGWPARYYQQNKNGKWEEKG